MQLHRRLIAFLLPCALWAQTVDDRQTVARPGNLHPLARAEYDSGVAPSDYRMERMMLVLEPDAAQQQALQALLAAQQDPQSSEYHQWLTPEQFGERFGVSNHDLGQVLNWLEAEGFQIEPVAAARRTIVFSGTAAQVETAFHTAIHIYDVNGERHYANATDPRIPAALAAVVSGVASLHDFRSSPQHTGARALPPTTEYTSGGTNYMAPADFATIYDVAALYSSSTDGTGQSIAVLGRSNILMPDVTKFRSMFGLSAVNPTVVLNGPNPGIISSSEQTEAELDVEWAGAVAKNAAIQFVLSASTSSSDGILLSGQYAVNHNLAPVISLSFGLCEAALGTAGNQFWNGLWQQAAAQGMTVLVASGDSGAAGCDSPSETKAVSAAGVNGLCSSPYSTCVGGTQFNEAGNASQYWSPTTNPATWGSALSYIPEMVWNSSGNVSGGSDLWASGGGASQVYPKPAWQAGMGVPSDGHRDVPDVALSASTHDAYLFCLSGQTYLVGGTSAATPSFAGLMAMAVERTGARLGNANPTLYGLATSQSTGGAASFHSITAGNNSVPGVVGFNAGSGYNLATGLGSVDAFVLVNHWSNATQPPPTTPGFQLTASTPTVVVGPGASPTVLVSVSVRGGFNSAVTLTAGTLPTGLAANFSPSNFAAPGSGVSTLTLSASATTAPGAYSLNLTANGGGITQVFPLQVTVQSQCTYTINPLSATPGAAGGNFPATVTANSGCSWTAVSAVSWISVVSGASGSGNGAFTYSVAANTATTPRSGSLSIAGQTLAVTEAGVAAAAAPLTPSSATFSAAGGRSSIVVALPPAYSYWSATSNAGWLVITSGANSTGGNNTVNYSVSANTAATRTGIITIAGVAFSVTQAGTSCSYGITLGKMVSAPGGVDGTVGIATQAACPWSATSNVSWISAVSGNPGAGSGTLSFFIAANPAMTVRTGVLSVAGYSIQITEGPAGNVEIGQPIH